MAADPEFVRRVADMLSQGMHRVEHSMQLVASSMRRIEESHSRRSSQPGMINPEDIVWSDPDGTTVCRVIARRPSIHEVELTLHGEVVSTRVFYDPVEAADEASRLRHLFLN